MIIHYKKKMHFIYLLLILILTYIGTFFTIQIVPSILDANFIHLSSLLFLYLNGLLVYWIALRHHLTTAASFLLATLYIVCPFHAAVFLFSPLIQYTLAETFLLTAYFFYLKEDSTKSTIFLIISNLLNFKLLGLVPFIYFSRKFTLQQKILLVANAGVIFIFSSSEIWNNFLNRSDSLKTVVYLFENLLNPFNINFLNYSILITNFYSYWFLVLIVLLLGAIGLYLRAKKDIISNSNVLFALIVGVLISIFIPAKYPLKAAMQFYFYTPTVYPYVLFITLMALSSLLAKYSNKFLISILSLLTLVWILANVEVQSNAKEVLGAWKNAVGKLPEDFEHEEIVKYDYATLLIKNDDIETAEPIVIVGKKKFLTEKWFTLHLRIAAQKKDEGTINLIYEELSKYKIPYSIKNKEE